MDCVTESMAQVTKIIFKNQRITYKTITTRISQANATLENAHQEIGNIINTFQVNNSKMDSESTCRSILLAVIFDMRLTVQTMMQYVNFYFF